MYGCPIAPEEDGFRRHNISGRLYTAPAWLVQRYQMKQDKDKDLTNIITGHWVYYVPICAAIKWQNYQVGKGFVGCCYCSEMYIDQVVHHIHPRVMSCNSNCLINEWNEWTECSKSVLVILGIWTNTWCLFGLWYLYLDHLSFLGACSPTFSYKPLVSGLAVCGWTVFLY